jgi:hypothetical protein
MELYDLEEGTSFTLIKADQYIDYMYADGSGSAGPAETDDAG